MNEIVPIVFIMDKFFTAATAAAIQSIAANNTAAVVIYIFATKDCKKYESMFSRYNSELVTIEWRDIDNQFDNIQTTNHVSNTALIKFKLPELLKEYDKFLYLDGDIVVKADLHELMNTDIKGNYAAAADDMTAVMCKFHESIELTSYFNSGVMLVNGKKCRDDNTGELLISAKLKHPEWPFMDQHAFNYIFDERIVKLHPKYNCMMWNIMESDFSLKEYNHFYSTDYHSLKEAEDDAVILHLTNFYKPWKYSDTYYSDQWMSIYNESAMCCEKISRQGLPEDIPARIPYPVYPPDNKIGESIFCSKRKYEYLIELLKKADSGLDINEKYDLDIYNNELLVTDINKGRQELRNIGIKTVPYVKKIGFDHCESAQDLKALLRKFQCDYESELERSLKEKEELIDNIYNSRSYRIGHAVLAIPRKIKLSRQMRNERIQDKKTLSETECAKKDLNRRFDNI